MTHANMPGLPRTPSRPPAPRGRARRLAGVAAAFGVCALSPLTAQAGAVFEAYAYVNLHSFAATYAVGGGDASGDLTATLDASDEVEDRYEEGDGSVDVYAVAIDDSATGDGWYVNGEMSGDSGPNEGYGYGTVNAYFDYSVTNASLTESILLSFTYDIGGYADSAITVDAAGVFYDAAVYTVALFQVDSVADCECEGEPSDPLGIFDLMEFHSDALFGPFGRDEGENFDQTFSYLLAPGETAYVTIEVFAGGFAEAVPTPLPAALPMMAAGLAGLGLLARRRKRAA